MRSVKEAAHSLGIDYSDLTGILRAFKVPKIFGAWRLNDKQIENIRILLQAGLDF